MKSDDSEFALLISVCLARSLSKFLVCLMYCHALGRSIFTFDAIGKIPTQWNWNWIWWWVMFNVYVCIVFCSFIGKYFEYLICLFWGWTISPWMDCCVNVRSAAAEKCQTQKCVSSEMWSEIANWCAQYHSANISVYYQFLTLNENYRPDDTFFSYFFHNLYLTLCRWVRASVRVLVCRKCIWK